MEKKLKKVQRGAAVGFVVLKILRILLIIAAVVTVAALVFLAVVNENNLPWDAVQDGKLVLKIQDMNLGQLGLSSVPDVGELIKDGVLNLDLKDAKLAMLLVVAAGLVALVGAYVLLLIAGNLFKHMKAEETPFTAGNVRRLRLLGTLHIVFWACGIALGYFVGSEFVRRLALPNSVSLNLNLSALLIALIFFFLARVFNFGKAQGEALKEAQSEIAPVPVFEPASAPEPVPAPVYEPVPEPVMEPVVEPAPEPEAVPAPEPQETPAAIEEPEKPEE